MRVDNFQHLQKIAFYCLITFLAIGLVHSIFVIIYSIDEDIVDEASQLEDLD